MKQRQRIAALAVLVAAALALSGCSLMDWLAPGAKEKAGQTTTPAPTDGTETTPQQPTEEVRTAVRADVLFPAADRQVIFEVTDEGQEPYRVTEELIREGNRIVATYNGVPYLQWVLNEQGVWRVDPRGGGALLRYLPPTLKNGESWKQVSGDAEVWFQLKEAPGRCVIPGGGAPAACWELQVLNRGEVTTFRFGTDLGPVEAVAVNFVNPEQSFVKRALETRPGGLTDETRSTHLAHPFPQGAESPVIPVTAEEFAAEVAKASAP